MTMSLWSDEICCRGRPRRSLDCTSHRFRQWLIVKTEQARQSAKANLHRRQYTFLDSFWLPTLSEEEERVTYSSTHAQRRLFAGALTGTLVGVWTPTFR